MAESETYRKGRELRRRLMGDAYAERLDRTAYADPIMKKFVDVATETVWGALWARPGLDLKTRALVCLVSDGFIVFIFLPISNSYLDYFDQYIIQYVIISYTIFILSFGCAI